MKKVFFLLFISFQVFAQDILFLNVDSTDIFVIKSAENIELKKMLENPENLTFMIDFSEKYHQDFNSAMINSKLLSTNIDELEMELFDKKQSQMKFLNNSKDKINPDLYTLISNEIKFNYWYQIFAFPIIRGNADQGFKKVVSLPTVISEGLNENMVNDDNLLKISSFRSLLYYYLTYQNSSKRKFEKYSDNLQATHDKSDYALNHFKGEVLDYLLADLLNHHKALLTQNLTKNILGQIKDKQYKDYFEGGFLETVVKNEEISNKIKAEEAANSIKNDWQDMLTVEGKPFDMSKYLGKVVYIDFWASWCGPCRKEMPFSKEMHESLTPAQKEKIVFLYISIDEKEEAWRTGMEKLGLNIFQNAFATGAWAAKVVQKFKITGIPRYMIMDKSGKVIKMDASRPSNPDTLKELILLAN